MPDPTLESVAAKAGDMEQKLAAVIGHWLRANRVAEAARREAVLDRASYDSFPASDPIAPAALCDPETDAQQLECVIDGDELTLRCAPRGATAPDQVARVPTLTLQGERSDGGRLEVRVHVRSMPSAEQAVGHSEAALPDDPVHAGPVTGPVAGERRWGERRAGGTRRGIVPVERRSGRERRHAPAAAL